MPDPDIYIDWEECPEIEPERSMLGKIMDALHGTTDRVEPEEDDPWRATRCLYVYFDQDWEPIYIGKAWATTVWSRFDAQDKDNLWEDVERETGLKPSDVIVMAGHIECCKVSRLTASLLTDLEALLIMQARPWANIQSRRSRKTRSGLVVECGGDWPLDAKIYVDHAS